LDGNLIGDHRDFLKSRNFSDTEGHREQGGYLFRGASVGEEQLELLADRLKGATRVTILTGAGVSAASGVPTFRGSDGLWRQFRAEDLATPGAFSRDPVLVWEWYAWRRELIAACRPNPAHDIIARWSLQFERCTVITQNVDDLHLQAGTANLLRVHGSIWELSCWRDCGAPAWRDETVPLSTLPPPCPACGGLARPAVVWFGEALPVRELNAAAAACNCDVFLTVGTSALVYPAAGLVHEARDRGAFTAEINLEATPASPAVDLAIRGPADQLLPNIAQRCTP
jgi:NAD-dependent deacetylase